MTNFLQRNYHELLLKYRKFSNRLDKKISNGSFWKLSNSKRALLLKRVEQLRKKLSILETTLGKTAVASAAALAFSVIPANAQFVNKPTSSFFVPVQIDTIVPNVYGAAPSLVNLDGDADLDLVVVEYDGDVTYLKNTGTASSPNFTTQTGSNNPFSSLNFPYDNPKFAFADIDNDGDFDLLSGAYNDLSFFANTGTSSAPVFVELTGTLDPFSGITFNNYVQLIPEFVDLDNDGDKDVIIGDSYNREIRYFRNTGSASIPSFSEQTGTSNPFSNITYYYNGFNIAITDLDGDNDFDLVMGQNNGTASYFKNIGTATAADFSSKQGNPLNGLDAGYNLIPEFGDLDADGDQDFVFGTGGNILYSENTGSASDPSFVLPLIIGSDATIRFVDLDNDGDHDLAVGDANSESLFYFKNFGSDSAPQWKAVVGTSSPFAGVSVIRFGSPTFADLNGDGKLDLISGQDGGYLRYYQNTGTASAASFSEVTGTELENNYLGDEIVPFLVDIDDDGDADIFAGDEDTGTLQFLKNVGTASSPSFTLVSGSDNPFDTLSQFRTKPEFTDLDGDGDFDVVVGTAEYSYYNISSKNEILYFKNTGTASVPSFVLQTGTNNPFNGITLDSPSPAFFDLGQDGDLDLFVADFDGKIQFYENQKILAAVNITDLSEEVTVYPNPASSEVTVKLGSSFTGDIKVEVLNMYGEVISSSSMVRGSELNISVDGLAAGVYYLKVVNGAQTGTKKIVKK